MFEWLGKLKPKTKVGELESQKSRFFFFFAFHPHIEDWLRTPLSGFQIGHHSLPNQVRQNQHPVSKGRNSYVLTEGTKSLPEPRLGILGLTFWKACGLLTTWIYGVGSVSLTFGLFICKVESRKDKEQRCLVSVVCLPCVRAVAIFVLFIFSLPPSRLQLRKPMQLSNLL